MTKKIKFSLFALIFTGLSLASLQLEAKPVTADTLSQILVKSDSIQKTLVYTGIVNLRYYAKRDLDLKLRVWRNRDLFYHQEIIAPVQSKERAKLKRRTRNKYSGLTIMPDKKYVELLLKNYNVIFEPGENVANRATEHLSIKPKNLPRFGLQIWFDKERFHILRREIIFFRENTDTPVLSMEYQNIQFDKLPPDSLVQLEKKKRDSAQKHTSSQKKIAFRNITELKKSIHKSVFVPQFIPQGCELVSIKYAKDKHREVTHLHYTDGILGLSLFQYFGEPPHFVGKMLQQNSASDDSTIEFRQLYATRRGEYSFLLIGNFSKDQLKKIAQSLRE